MIAILWLLSKGACPVKGDRVCLEWIKFHYPYCVVIRIWNMWCLFSHLSPISTNYYFTPSSYYSVRRPPITLSEKSIEQNVSWKSSITYKCSLVKWVIVHMALNQEANLIWFALSALYIFFYPWSKVVKARRCLTTMPWRKKTQKSNNKANIAIRDGLLFAVLYRQQASEKQCQGAPENWT